MLQQSTPESRLSDAAWLDQRMAEFKKQGGRINALPGFEYKPRPERFHPDPRPKQVIPLSKMAEKDERDMADLTRFAAQGYTLRYARLCMNLNQARAERLASRLRGQGIEFRSVPKSKPE